MEVKVEEEEEEEKERKIVISWVEGEGYDMR